MLMSHIVFGPQVRTIRNYEFLYNCFWCLVPGSRHASTSSSDSSGTQVSLA